MGLWVGALLHEATKKHISKNLDKDIPYKPSYNEALSWCPCGVPNLRPPVSFKGSFRPREGSRASFRAFCRAARRVTISIPIAGFLLRGLTLRYHNKESIFYGDVN